MDGTLRYLEKVTKAKIAKRATGQSAKYKKQRNIAVIQKIKAYAKKIQDDKHSNMQYASGIAMIEAEVETKRKQSNVPTICTHCQSSGHKTRACPTKRKKATTQTRNETLVDASELALAEEGLDQGVMDSIEVHGVTEESFDIVKAVMDNDRLEGFI